MELTRLSTVANPSVPAESYELEKAALGTQKKAWGTQKGTIKLHEAYTRTRETDMTGKTRDYTWGP